MKGLEEFQKAFEQADKSALERQLYSGKTTNALRKRFSTWLKSLNRLNELASILGFEIHFTTTQKKKK